MDKSSLSWPHITIGGGTDPIWEGVRKGRGFLERESERERRASKIGSGESTYSNICSYLICEFGIGSLGWVKECWARLIVGLLGFTVFVVCSIGLVQFISGQFTGRSIKEGQCTHKSSPI